jgi:hypothetical protein
MSSSPAILATSRDSGASRSVIVVMGVLLGSRGKACEAEIYA